MKNKNESLLSRREFTRKAAVLSATMPLVSAEAILPKAAAESPGGQAQGAPALSLAGQAEADTRYQQIVTLYGSRLNEEQRTKIKQMCTELQPMLERVRSFKLENGDAPALYLKPLVERAKKPQPAAKSGGKKS